MKKIVLCNITGLMAVEYYAIKHACSKDDMGESVIPFVIGNISEACQEQNF